MIYMSDEQKAPFKELGERLKAVRQKMQESAPDVCGAVEIEVDMLERIEKGVERPTEDILQLLINHFDLHEQAENLWQLAGYEMPDDQVNDPQEPQLNRPGQAMMIMAIDPRIIYSDQVHVNANKNGVVLNFAQRANNPQPLMVSRIGMSREQARDVANIIQEALQRSEPRRLPNPKKDNPDQKTPESSN